MVLFRCHPSRPVRVYLWFLLLTLALPLARAVCATVDAVPHLTITAGEAQLKSNGTGVAWVPIQNGDAIPFGQVLRVGKTFEGVLTYPDGTTLTLKPSTTLQVIVDGLRLYRGQTWIKVVKQGSGFRCITPSAIASVRGTKFSVEVPSIARLFHARYVNEFFNPRHLVGGLKAQLVATSIGLAVLASLVQDAPGGQVPVATKVFEGKVFVTYNNGSETVLQSWLLTAGQKVSTRHGVNATKEPFTVADATSWCSAEPVAPPAPRPEASAAPERNTGKANGGVELNPIRLMNESYDAPY